MRDPRQRFSAVADDYDRFRPSYPTDILDWLQATTGVGPGARVADLGCGTGIFSRLLAARGLAVLGIDANQDMLAAARVAGGAPAYLRGEAKRTGLASASVALVTAAQAFHWFALAPTLAEIARILVPGGWACALWNLRAPSPFNDDYEALLLEHASEYAASRESIDPRVKIAAAVAGHVLGEADASDALAWPDVIGRVRSASYVAHGVTDRARFEDGVRAAFERHARPDGTLVWRMRAIAIAWPRPDA